MKSRRRGGTCVGTAAQPAATHRFEGHGGGGARPPTSRNGETLKSSLFSLETGIGFGSEKRQATIAWACDALVIGGAKTGCAHNPSCPKRDKLATPSTGQILAGFALRRQWVVVLCNR